MELKHSRFFSSPARVICISFALVIAVGTLLLALPFSSRTGQPTPLVNAFFTATSATCVTGLIVYDTFTHWNFFGQLVMLCLIQIGGLGLVTFVSFFSVATGRKLGLRGMQLAQESLASSSMANIAQMTRQIVFASLCLEGIGAMLLLTVFVPEYGVSGIWISIFLAVSAFCNGGFDILGREEAFVSLCNYGNSPTVLLTIGTLIALGGLGFVVWKDLWEYRKTKKLTLQTRVVLSMTGLLLVVGTLVFLLAESGNTMAGMPFGEKLMGSFFQSITLRTAGFNSIDMAGLRPITKGISCILMFIGAASGSTGGGVKVTTFAVIIMTVVSVVQGREDTVLFRRKVGQSVVYRSLAVLLLSLTLVSTVALSLSLLLPQANGLDVFFETISAFATVGVSVGVTGIATTPAKLLLIMLMYLGRVGPISFVYAMAARQATRRGEIIPEGKIMVG